MLRARRSLAQLREEDGIESPTSLSPTTRVAGTKPHSRNPLSPTVRSREPSKKLARGASWLLQRRSRVQAQGERVPTPSFTWLLHRIQHSLTTPRARRWESGVLVLDSLTSDDEQRAREERDHVSLCSCFVAAVHLVNARDGWQIVCRRCGCSESWSGQGSSPARSRTKFRVWKRMVRRPCPACRSLSLARISIHVRRHE